MTIDKVLILGNNGGFGRLFSSLLKHERVHITGTDLASRADEPTWYEAYVGCDLNHPNADVLAIAQQSDCVLSCLPESVTLRAVASIAPALRPGTLVTDILSVKTNIVNAWSSLRCDIQVLSIHPMFAPDVGFNDQNVAAIAVRPGPRADDFLAWIERWGATVTSMSVEEHDRQMAIIQGVTHAVIIAYGLCLAELGYDPSAGAALMSRPHRALLALFARVASLDPGVYWSIQADNPFAPAARKALVSTIETFDSMVRAGERKEFDRRLHASKQQLAPMLDDLTAHAIRMLQMKS
jgi:4-amino-4-deoxyprephenate dehydrogenase